MLVASEEYKRQINNDNRNYLVKIEMTLANETALTFQNEQIWDGSLTFTDAVSDPNSFNIGSAIIGQCSFDINNIDDSYSEYDFYNARFTLYMGLALDEEHIEYVKRGVYTVDSATYNGSIISITALDNMWMFDVPYTTENYYYDEFTNCSFHVTNIVEACMGSASYLATPYFPNAAFVISEPPKEKMNCREVLQYIAQICGCFCHMNADGDLELKWYEANESSAHSYDGGTFLTHTTPYSDGDEVEGGEYYFDEHGNYVWTDTEDYDGGSFIEAGIDYITQCSEINVGIDPIIITGVRVYNNSNSEDEAYDVTRGTSGYVLGITDNPFITKANCQAVANIIFSMVGGMEFRTFDAQCLDNVLYEVGDYCELNDFRGNRFHSFITNLTFTIGNYEHFSCGAETPAKRLQIKYSKELKTLVEAERKAAEQISSYDMAVQRMNMLAANASGNYFISVEQEDGSMISYLSNKPLSKDEDGNVIFTYHSHVWKITGEGFFQTPSCGHGESDTAWVAGVDANNNMVMQTVSTIGLNAEWIRAGYINANRIQAGSITANKLSFTPVGSNNIVGTINASTEGIKIHANKLTLTGLVTINNLKNQGETVINGANITTGNINCNRLNGGTISGQNISGGNVRGAYISSGDTNGDPVTNPQHYMEGSVEISSGHLKVRNGTSGYAWFEQSYDNWNDLAFRGEYCTIGGSRWYNHYYDNGSWHDYSFNTRDLCKMIEWWKQNT